LYVKHELQVYVRDVDGSDGQKWRVFRILHPKRFVAIQELYDVRRCLCCEDGDLFLQIKMLDDGKTAMAYAPHSRGIGVNAQLQGVG
jgi:hypothetical protein